MRTHELESRPAAASRAGRPGRRTLSLALVALVSLLVAAPARADVGEEIILRCTHEESLSGFSQADYRKALKELSADTEEYSECPSLIRRAALSAATGGAGGGGGAGNTGAPTAIAATPSEQRAIAHAQQAGSGPVELGGGTVHPGVVHVGIASALSSLPDPLLATLAFLLLCLLLVIGDATRKSIRARRPD